jgi:hypothetical protein
MLGSHSDLYVSSYYHICVHSDPSKACFTHTLLLYKIGGCLGRIVTAKSSQLFLVCRASRFTQVLILLYMCPHTPTHVSSYSYMCPHTPIYVSSHYYMCPHTPVYVSSYSFVCRASRFTQVVILLCMCPHTSAYVSSYSCILLYMCPHTPIYVSSYS